MRKYLVMAVALVATGMFSGTGSAQNTVTREKLLSIVLVDDTIYAEAYYNGSSFSGGGIMSCYATYRITVRNKATGAIVDRYTEVRNVSLDANWSSSDENVYGFGGLNNYVYDAPVGQEDGLWVYGGDSSVIGTTVVTATFGGKTATGTITFWAD